MRWRTRSHGTDLLPAGAVLAALWVVARLLAEPDVDGRPRVVDGDTLILNDRRIRLAGIDAPELEQICERGGRAIACGREAAGELRALIGSGQVTCRRLTGDRYGRDVSMCRAAGRDLGADMMSRGQAVSWYSYPAEEAEARLAGRGIWAGKFDLPSRWRIDHARRTDVRGHTDSDSVVSAR